jgi:prepilin-type N-terminal cleavage/methylation domain-containing protein
MKNRRSGFTLVEIMIVVLIIGLILAVAVPNLLMARENAGTKGCIGNLRQVLHAKQMFSMEHNAASTYEVNWDDIMPYLRGGQPTCPTGGTYELLTVAELVTCSRPNHKLP